jgi:hypothetical protein
MLNYETQSHARDLIRDRLREAERARLAGKAARRFRWPRLPQIWLPLGLGRAAALLPQHPGPEPAVRDRRFAG